MPWGLFLSPVEAVTSHGPVTPKRVEELEHLMPVGWNKMDWPLRGLRCHSDVLQRLPLNRTYARTQMFKRYVDKIAWETEVTGSLVG